MSSTEGVRRRLDVETGRFLFDDGRTMPRRPASGKSQGYRRGEGWAAAGQHAGSHMRQEDRVSVTSLHLPQAVRDAQNLVNAERRFPSIIETTLLS